MDLRHLKKLILSIKSDFREDLSDLERDGIVFRFKIAFEYSWKISQSTLLNCGIEAISPKEVFRQLGKWNWISNVENWLMYYDLANAFKYHKKMEYSQQDLKFVIGFISDSENLISSIEKRF